MDENPQSNRQKAYFHSARAEYWQDLIERYEDEAVRKGQIQGQQRQRVTGAETDTNYIAKSLLKDHPGYALACGNRNGHQTQATMYGILAILDATRFPEAIPSIPVPDSLLDG